MSSSSIPLVKDRRLLAGWTIQAIMVVVFAPLFVSFFAFVVFEVPVSWMESTETSLLL